MTENSSKLCQAPYLSKRGGGGGGGGCRGVSNENALVLLYDTLISGFQWM